MNGTDGPGTQIYFELEVGSGCDIYVTSSIDNPTFAWPSRYGYAPVYPTIKVSDGATFQIPYGHTMYIRAFSYKPNWTQSVNISEGEQHNPNL